MKDLNMRVGVRYIVTRPSCNLEFQIGDRIRATEDGAIENIDACGWMPVEDIQAAQIGAQTLSEGEIYIGFISGHTGAGHHLILLPGDNDAAKWQVQMDWAKSIGGDLPNLVEQSMLWAHHRDQFWYWSNETHHNNSGWALSQGLCKGNQGYGSKLHAIRARAVRRVSP